MGREGKGSRKEGGRREVGGGGDKEEGNKLGGKSVGIALTVVLKLICCYLILTFIEYRPLSLFLPFCFNSFLPGYTCKVCILLSIDKITVIHGKIYCVFLLI